MPAPPPSDRDPLPGSPAATVSLVGGVLALLVSLNDAAYVLALFLAAVALAAVPLAVADRAGPRLTRRALLGGACAALALVLVVVPLLFGEQQQQDRREPVAPRRVSLGAGAGAVVGAQGAG